MSTPPHPADAAACRGSAELRDAERGRPRPQAAGAAGPRRGLASLLGAPWRRALESLLGEPRCGELTVQLPDGQRFERRGALPGPHGEVVVHRWRALRRLALQGDIGLAAAYRDGDVSCSDLTALLEFGVRNERARAYDPSWPLRPLLRALHRLRDNTRRGSRRNIAFHYDLGNAFYAPWLGREMLYSSALYADPAAGDAAQSLDAAQAAKLRRVIELLQLDRLDAGASVLEIGCGWGALAAAIAREHPVQVTGLTLSTEQWRHATTRIAAEGLQQRVELRLQDYRDVDGAFDRIVSIEMLEAVGERHWPTYFEQLRRRLRPGGRAVVQVITIADAHFEHYRRGTDFIQRYIFPGGMLPSPGTMREQAARAGLAIESVETFGASYAATLREWRRRFLRARAELERLGYDRAFGRLWEYYLCYCEAGFRTRRVDVALYVLTPRD